jgi:HSP20 family molecular chaperone IbpA
MSIKISPVKSIDCVLYFVPAIGCDKEDIEVKSDCDGNDINAVYIKTKRPEHFSDKSYDLIEFEQEIRIDVDKMYDVENLEGRVKGGLLTIKIPSNSNRIKKIDVV